MPTHPLWRAFEQPTQAEIDAARVSPPAQVAIEVVPHDPAWLTTFAMLRDVICDVLGARALSVTHVGSTAVPGMWAKPVIDVDLVVPDSAREDDYVPDLEAAGFELVVREPEWEEHRCLRLREPQTNLHVFSPGAGEPQRHLLFRDWLSTHPDDHLRYAEAKRAVAAQGFTDPMHYNNAKGGAVYDIYERIFAADSDHRHDPRPRH